MSVVSTVEHVHGELTLASDIRRIRAALLYADEIELVSLGTQLTGLFSQAGNLNDDQLFEIFLSLDDGVINRINPKTQLPPGWREAARLMHKTDASVFELAARLTGQELPPNLRKVQSDFRDILSRSTGNIRENMEGLLERSGAAELTPAIKAGLVKVASIDLGTYETNEIFEAYTSEIKRLLLSSRTSLLFDDSSAAIARHLVETGIQPLGTVIQDAREAALGTGLIARLPALDRVSIDELIDVRAELRGPLVRYRKAIGDLTGLIKSGVLDISLHGEIDRLFRNEVEVALVELQEGMADHTIFREAARALGSDIKTLISGTVGPAITYVVANAAGAGDIAAAAVAALPAAASVVHAGAAGAIAQHAFHVAARQSPMFYLYEVDRRFSPG
jgi:hypothetical protein